MAAAFLALLSACGSDAEPPAPKPPTPLRIMALGDSITDGPYYRFALMDRLDGAGCLYDFVGSQSDVDDGNERAGYDPDHEGYGGWRADELREGVVEWTTAARPDVVLLHVGVNDLYASQSAGSTEQDIDGIIAGVRTANPAITVLLAQIIPGSGVEAQVDDLNAGLLLLAGELDRPNSRVLLVDQNSGFDVLADTVEDNVHPNEVGGEKMADRWFDALTSISDAPCFD